MDNPIRFIKGVGPKREKLLNRVGVFSGGDLLHYFPSRYEDRTKIDQISSLKENTSFLIKAELSAFSVTKSFYGRKSVAHATLKDSSGTISSVWFNRPYLKSYLEKGECYYFYGKVRAYQDKLQLVSADFEKIDSEDGPDILGIVPIYPLTQGLTQNALRRVVHSCLSTSSKQAIDSLPFQVRKEYDFPNIVEALGEIHFPCSFPSLKKVRERFIFEEFFTMQLLVYRRKAEFKLKARCPLKIDHSVVDRVKKNFGYTLTSDQEKTLSSLLADLSSESRSSRLLQGDVGSGKTVVAAIACFCVALRGYQVAFMVPTEILALQHKKTLDSLAKGLKINIDVITSGTPKLKKKIIYSKLAASGGGIIVGTHALLNEKLKFKNLRLIVIDEQHRFGVAQRVVLSRKGLNPDILTMSATPIPRSLDLTVYGDMEVSLIKEYPKGHNPPESTVVEERSRKDIYKFIKDKVKEGRQAYIVYALVDQTEEKGLYSAVSMYRKLSRKFKGFSLGLMHGRLNSKEKEQVLDEFRNKKIDILVSTLVVEVGVDVPNATVMMVESPEKFGLAQLHQLRGRIMRSTLPSYFFMVAKKGMGSSSAKRIKVIKNTNDGFRIAEEDLELRGPGDLFGTLQAGYLPKRIASIQEDFQILQNARSWAFKIIKKDPYLELREHKNLNLNLKNLLDRCMFWQAS